MIEYPRQEPFSMSTPQVVPQQHQIQQFQLQQVALLPPGIGHSVIQTQQIPQQPLSNAINVKGTSGKSIKNKFTPEEDDKLRQLVMAYGTNSWSTIAQLMGTRNHRQCRERWKNYIDPSLRNDPWTFEDDHLLVEKYAEFGPKWNKIAKFFQNRSDNSIRNRWQLIIRQWERQNSKKVMNDYAYSGSADIEAENSTTEINV
ncbi:Myb-like DNA-binding domain containing protein [Tritrichomonas foetus]|uniref:Myb-like DNA-binding domain containing protein n=1 Tax=Tritrichomonas foetus TaxID=1144522 RepID=A0A1J4JQ21_9EUKA|nr:Myb-like DNA-binding domain containing protein [Tritrichomonas foetus]|eukprot:OHT00520.1 Myb-like DNA-binding domain containing protein [Tritrichomonas foetus]